MTSLTSTIADPGARHHSTLAASALLDTPDEPDPHVWLAEHERTLQRVRARVSELEHAVERAQGLATPRILAVATLASLLFLTGLPWLSAHDESASGWTLLIASLEHPFSATAAYAVAAALAAQAVALLLGTRWAALAACGVSGLATVTATSFVISVARGAEYRPASALIVSTFVLLGAACAWGQIASVLREE